MSRPDSRASSSPAPWLVWTSLAVVTLVAYSPALRAGFIWNDSEHVTLPSLRSLSGLWRIWFQLGATEQYYPVLHSAFWLQWKCWGDAPLGYHVVNLLTHAMACGLFFHVLRRLAVPGAWLAALLFALHPIGVESVAWISELKNTLSTSFYLAAALAYLSFDRERSRANYGLALFFFVAALLSKSVTASLPAALLVIFWWQRGRLDLRREVIPLLPFFVAGAGAGLFTAWMEVHYIGAYGSDFALSWLDRLVLAPRTICFYLGKIIWPGELIFIYPHWDISAARFAQWFSPLLVFAATAALWIVHRHSRAPLAVVLLFGGTLFPVLGFFDVYPFRFSYVADHFAYLALLAPLALTGAILSKVAIAFQATGSAGAATSRSRMAQTSPLPPSPKGQRPPFAFAALALSLLLVFGFLTWRQAGLYRDIETFYRLTLERNPSAWMAHNNLGNLLLADGRVDEALVHLEKSVALKSDFAESQSNLGVGLAQAGRPAEAVAHYEAALRLTPGHPGFIYNLALALRQQGKSADALAQLRTLVRTQPAYADAWNELGLCELDAGRSAEAATAFETAIRVQPAHVEALNHLAEIDLAAGRNADAFRRLDQALAAEPDSSETHTHYAIALSQLRRLDEALPHFRAALRQHADDPEPHINLAIALVQAGELKSAVGEFNEALRLNPNDADTRAKLASVLQQLNLR